MFTSNKQIKTLTERLSILDGEIKTLSSKVETLLNPPKPKIERKYTLFLNDKTQQIVVNGYSAGYSYGFFHVRDINGQDVAVFTDITGYTSETVLPEKR
jgi:hypothetical protein